MKQSYPLPAASFGPAWKGRRYDRAHPDEADAANQAIKHAAVQGSTATDLDSFGR